MRAVVQRVVRAAVKVDGAEIAHIEHGYAVLVGVSTDDTDADAKTLAKRSPTRASSMMSRGSSTARSLMVPGPFRPRRRLRCTVTPAAAGRRALARPRPPHRQSA